MHTRTSRLGAMAVGAGMAAVFGAGGIVFGAGPASASPAGVPESVPTAARTAPAAASSVRTAPTPETSDVGACMSGAILGSAASPVIHQPSHVLRTRNGYTLHHTSGSTMGQSGNSGPGTGGLRPVGSPTWHYSPWTTYTARHPGPTGPVMSGAILGSAASPMIHQPSHVLRTRNGYTLHHTSGSTMGQSGNSGPGAGGLRPVGSPSWHYSPWTTYSAGCPGGHGG